MVFFSKFLFLKIKNIPNGVKIIKFGMSIQIKNFVNISIPSTKLFVSLIVPFSLLIPIVYFSTIHNSCKN